MLATILWSTWVISCSYTCTPLRGLLIVLELCDFHSQVHVLLTIDFVTVGFLTIGFSSFGILHKVFVLHVLVLQLGTVDLHIPVGTPLRFFSFFFAFFVQFVLTILPRSCACPVVPGLATLIRTASTWLRCRMKFWSMRQASLLSSVPKAWWPLHRTPWGMWFCCRPGKVLDLMVCVVMHYL